MILYNVIIKLSSDKSNMYKGIEEKVAVLSREFENDMKQDCCVQICKAKENIINMAVLLRKHFINEADIRVEIEKRIPKYFDIGITKGLTVKEITTSQFKKLLLQTGDIDEEKQLLGSNIQDILPIIAMCNYKYGVSVREEIIKVHKRKSYYKNRIRTLNADITLTNEMERIFSSKHPTQYKGIPVHYKINFTSSDNVEPIVNFLIQGLYFNNRTLSKRVTYIKAESIYGFEDESVEQVIRGSEGGCIVIEIDEKPSRLYSFNDEETFNTDNDWLDESSGWENLWEFGSEDNIKKLATLIEKYSLNTQFILVENLKYSKNTKRLYDSLKQKINIVEINEGLNGELAQNKFINMVKEGGLIEFKATDEYFDKDKFYSIEDVEKMYRKYYQKCMINHLYTEYDFKNKSEEKEVIINSYDELNRMIGLEKVKSTIDAILAVNKVNKMRTQHGYSEKKYSRHMVFMGNPGTAKTSVARLIAAILKEEGVLESGKFVECTRADLVGQYVGWTAIQVKEKFKEAKGGVLFIDEAYSLVDDTNSFGDEAINTIVSEMENMRDEVLVIFAGYPEKMKKFIEKNEGIKSRINYHISFPDYEPKELLQILIKIAEDQKFILDDAAKEKAIAIFKKVYKEQNFGNGRFVRNLFENAVVKQAIRISGLPIEAVNESILFRLTKDDFEIDCCFCESSNKNRAIGFITNYEVGA